MTTNVSQPTTTPPSTVAASVSPSEATIRQLNSSITTFSLPFVRTGAEVGVRMSVIREPSGDLILYNPTLLDDTTRQYLHQLGTVKYIVLPNIVHHMFAAPYATAFPQAKFIGPEGMKEKKKDQGVNIAVEMTDPTIDYSDKIGWSKDIDYIYFKDFANKEIALFHRPTKTLFLADMLWNLPAIEQYANVKDKNRAPSHASPYGLQAVVNHHLSPEGWLGKALNWIADKPTPEFKQGMKKMIQIWTPETIVPEHGEVITNDAEARLRSNFKWVKWDH